MRNTYFLQAGQPIEGVFAHKGNALGDIDHLQTFGHIGGVGLICARAEDITEPGDTGVLKTGTDEGQSDLG